MKIYNKKPPPMWVVGILLCTSVSTSVEYFKGKTLWGNNKSLANPVICY